MRRAHFFAWLFGVLAFLLLLGVFVDDARIIDRERVIKPVAGMLIKVGRSYVKIE